MLQKNVTNMCTYKLACADSLADEVSPAEDVLTEAYDGSKH